MKISKAGISDRMQYIDPQVYIDMNDDLISSIYSHPEEFNLFKGFHLASIDASIIENTQCSSNKRRIRYT